MPNSWKEMIDSGMHICDAEFKRIRELEKKNNNNQKREKASSAKDSAPVVSSETLDADKAFFKLTPDGKRKKYEVPEHFMKREYPRSAMRVSRQSGVEVKWCENERSWLGSLYEGREAVLKDSPDPDAMRAIMEGKGRARDSRKTDEKGDKERTWYAREIAFLDSKAPKTEFEGTATAAAAAPPKEKKSKKKAAAEANGEEKTTKKKKKQKAAAVAEIDGDLGSLDLELTQESLASEVARLTEQLEAAKKAKKLKNKRKKKAKAGGAEADDGGGEEEGPKKKKKKAKGGDGTKKGKKKKTLKALMEEAEEEAAAAQDAPEASPSPPPVKTSAAGASDDDRSPSPPPPPPPPPPPAAPPSSEKRPRLSSKLMDIAGYKKDDKPARSASGERNKRHRSRDGFLYHIFSQQSISMQN